MKFFTSMHCDMLTSLPLLALNFVHVKLKIDRDDPKLNQPRYWMDKALLAWCCDDDELGSFNKLAEDQATNWT